MIKLRLRNDQLIPTYFLLLQNYLANDIFVDNAIYIHMIF